MSPNERKALAALAEHYSEDFGYLRFATIASESGLAPYLVRRTVRSLARKGFAEYGKGLWTDDGQLAGAGYRATQAGLDVIYPATPSPIEIAGSEKP